MQLTPKPVNPELALSNVALPPKRATDIEAAHGNGMSSDVAYGSPVSRSGLDPNNDMAAGLATLDIPFFKPYWSAGFFVTSVSAILMIWSFCWLYVGAFWNPTTRLKNLHVTVLNCDVVPIPLVDPAFAPLLPQLVPTPLATGLLSSSVYNQSFPLSRTLYWQPGSCPGATASSPCGSPAHEAACIADLAEDVRQGGAWAVLYFSSNFTRNYLSWFATSGLLPQNQPPVATYYYARGRDYSTYTYLAQVVLNTLLPGLSRALTAGLAANAKITALLAPGFLASGITTQPVDLAPVKNFGQHFATYIFCVLLWLGSSFVVGSSYQFKLPTEVLLDPKHPRHTRGAPVPAADPAGPQAWGSGAAAAAGSTSEERMVRLSHLMWTLSIKGAVSVIFMFCLMILLCVVLWALGNGNEQWFYNPGYAIAFGWYMSWSFISINAVLLHVTGIERFSSVTALLLILQLTSASGIMSIELCNRFFYIGKGLPFFYGVRGFRTIFFGALENKMYINWLVFTAYNVVFMPLGLLLVAHRVWTAPERARKQQQNGKAGVEVGKIVMPVMVGFA